MPMVSHGLSEVDRSGIPLKSVGGGGPMTSWRRRFSREGLEDEATVAEQSIPLRAEPLE